MRFKCNGRLSTKRLSNIPLRTTFVRNIGAQLSYTNCTFVFISLRHSRHENRSDGLCLSSHRRRSRMRLQRCSCYYRGIDKQARCGGIMTKSPHVVVAESACSIYTLAVLVSNTCPKRCTSDFASYFIHACIFFAISSVRSDPSMLFDCRTVFRRTTVKYNYNVLADYESLVW